MLIYFSVLIFIYCYWILWLYYHWQQIPEVNIENKPSFERIFFSIVIPVRNEAENIQKLLNDIAQQSFPANQFEVIVIDDDSTDQTCDIVSTSVFQYALTVISLAEPENFLGSHKKLAISQAILKTKNQPDLLHIILTTDGDGRVGCDWLKAYAETFATQQPRLVSGPVTFHDEKTLFEKLQTIEFSSLIGTGAASIQAGSPNMCNGANLAFSKVAFQEVGGYAGNMDQPSGDDEFLMRKIYEHYPDKIVFLKDPRSIVHTCAQKNLRSFYHQRRRWAGKWRAHKNWKAGALAVFVFVFYMSLLLTMTLTMIGLYPKKIFLLQMGAKLLCEFLFLNAVMSFLGKTLHIGMFMLLQLIYPFYAIFFGVAAHLGSYHWKGRRYQ